MADSTKEYAWYLEGNELAIVEKDVNFDNNVDSKEFGPGTSRQLWKSPQSTVTDGLEVKYVYAPTYRLNGPATTQINKFYISGWTVEDGYLTFVRSQSAGVANWASSTPYNAVAVDEYIAVSGSERWNGVHKVKAVGDATAGTIQTYTKVNLSIPLVSLTSGIDIAGEADDKSLINTNDGTHVWLNALFSVGDYIYTTGLTTAHNRGMWEVHSLADDASAESSSGIYIKNRYYVIKGTNDLYTEGIDTTINTTAEADQTGKIYKVFRDFCFIQADITALEDESFELDLPSYLQKALIYYVKGKLAEDGGNIKAREYAMREFKKMVEKYENSRISGPRVIFPGAHAIR